MITKQTVAEKINSYLNHQITLAQLVDWSENVLSDGEIADEDIDIVSEVVARLGVADVKNFGLLWEECDALLQKLGYKLEFKVNRVA
jgi:hypothetical protein